MVEYQHQAEFERLVDEYKRVPTSKSLLYNMVRFEDLYKLPSSQHDPLWLLPEFTSPLLPRTQNNLKRAEIYNVGKDVIQVRSGKHGKRLMLTSKGKKVYFDDYPLSQLREREWDHSWTMIAYDLPARPRYNALRDALRKKLHDYGFGTFQQSIMVSPLPLAKPIYAYIESEGLEEHVLVTRSERVFGLTDEEIARQAFELDYLWDLYDELYNSYSELKDNKQELQRWRLYYLAVDFRDPQLPNELLPDDWSGSKVRKQFRDSFSVLEKILG